MRQPLQGKPDTDPPRLLRDYAWYNFLQPLFGAGRPNPPARGPSNRRLELAAGVNGSAHAGGRWPAAATAS